MIYVSIFACVLALAAAGFAAGALLISRRQVRAVAGLRSQIAAEWQRRAARFDAEAKRISDALRAVEAQTPAKLAAEVAELSEAVQRVADTHRRFAGKVWSIIGERKPAAAGNGVDDDELSAMLQLQTAQPARQ